MQLIESNRRGVAGAYDRAVEALYAELRALAHSQIARLTPGQTLHTTALVNEAYLRMQKSSKTAVDRDHFLAIAATAMRHVVIDYARTRKAAKRGGGAVHVDIGATAASVAAQADQLVQIDEALGALAAQSPRMVRVFECKFFAGLDDAETAAAMGVSKRTAQREWMKARAFLAELLDAPVA